MNFSLNSKLLAVKYVVSLLKFSKNIPNHIQVIDSYYLGVNSEELPLKIIKGKNPLGRTIILYPGASPLGEEHPAMIFLGSALANIGFNVYIPRIPLLKKLDISEKNVELFDNAYQQLSIIDDIKDTKVTCMGVSYGGAILLKCSLSGFMNKKKPHCLITYGTIYDIPTSLEFLMSGNLNIKGKTVNIKPHEWGVIVGFYNFLSKIDVGYDTSDIQSVLKIRIRDKVDEAFQSAEKLDQRNKQLALDILNGTMSDEINRIISIIQAEQIHTLDSISPRNWCEKIHSKVFIMHGANDNMVPYTQSIKLSKHIDSSELFISYLYEHNEIAPKRAKSHKLKELLRLIKFFEKFLKYHEN